MLSALETALEFMMKHGGMPHGAYLQEVKNIESGRNKGYYFGFDYRIKGLPIRNGMPNMNYPIEITIPGKSGELRNQIQGLVLAREWEFESPLRHHKKIRDYNSLL